MNSACKEGFSFCSPQWKKIIVFRIYRKINLSCTKSLGLHSVYLHFCTEGNILDCLQKRLSGHCSCFSLYARAVTAAGDWSPDLPLLSQPWTCTFWCPWKFLNHHDGREQFLLGSKDMHYSLCGAMEELWWCWRTHASWAAWGTHAWGVTQTPLPTAVLLHSLLGKPASNCAHACKISPWTEFLLDPDSYWAHVGEISHTKSWHVGQRSGGSPESCQGSQVRL